MSSPAPPYAPSPVVPPLVSILLSRWVSWFWTAWCGRLAPLFLRTVSFRVLVGCAVVALRAQSARDNDGFLGCLAVVGPMSLYGFVTNTHLKFIIALRSSGPHDYKDSTVKAVRLDGLVDTSLGFKAPVVFLFCSISTVRWGLSGVAHLPLCGTTCRRVRW